jgi:acyl carrier protein
MTKEQFLALIDELLELDSGTLQGDEKLDDLDWNSLAVIGFMALADEHFGVSVTPASLARCKSIDDLAGIVGNKIVGDKICAPQPA